MRAAIAATLLVLAGCGSGEPTPIVTSSSTTTTTVAPTTTTVAKSQFLQVWERELKAASPRSKCQGADAFTPACSLALENYATTIEKLAKTVAVDGAKYFDAGLKALEVRDAARKWNEQCITEPPEVRNKRGCVQTILFVANQGEDAILAEIYEAEQTR